LAILISPVIKIERRDRGIVAARFSAMASDCEVLIETNELELAQELGQLAAAEAWRIEKKYSRYRDDSIVSAIHRSRDAFEVDAETATLIDYAAQCYALSNGLFDITSGVLRHLWKFDGTVRVPTQPEIETLLLRVGFHHLKWESPYLHLPAHMELDFGGIGKEYAVDRAIELIINDFSGAVLVNFGGDLRVSHAPTDGPWQVGVEQPGQPHFAQLLLDLSQGALATSGSTHRFFHKDGVRYGHILNPKNGRPVPDAPLSVTVAAATCVEAGTWSTFAMLQGSNAERFLEDEELHYWCMRGK
jgi:thiamine biosynthesis lipoprotein